MTKLEYLGVVSTILVSLIPCVAVKFSKLTILFAKNVNIALFTHKHNQIKYRIGILCEFIDHHQQWQLKAKLSMCSH